MASMASVPSGAETGPEEPVVETPPPKPPMWRIYTFVLVLILDATTAVLLMMPILPGIRTTEGATGKYSLYGSLWDLGTLALLRVIVATVGLVWSYAGGQYAFPRLPFELYHPNGERKTRDELEEEASEEGFCPWFGRYLCRPSFLLEMLAFLSEVLAIIKCLARMAVEAGFMTTMKPFHPVFWIAILLTAVLALIEATMGEPVTKLVNDLTTSRGTAAGEPPVFRSLGSSLVSPLLPNEYEDEETYTEGATEVDEETATFMTDDKDARGVSDIGPDTTYKATWGDVFSLLKRDGFFIFLAFVFLLLAAVAQVYIPRFTGNIIDALANEFANDAEDTKKHMKILDVPGFLTNVRNLVIAAILGGIFSGIRGSIFTLVGARVNVRLRVQLMDSLLAQDIGFFDVTRTGDITSRLSGDTTLVGDQVSLNINVFLRSLVQAIGVLIFMFVLSWQLSVISFISVPAIAIMSKWYGSYLSGLSKLMQKKLADGNAVSDAAVSSMAAVRSFDAARSEMLEFEDSMAKYLYLARRVVTVYSGYAICFTTMPQLVTALVLFFGGLFIRNGNMTSGELVSFLLYLTSLSDAFDSMGYIFTSLTQATGAASRVFELIKRNPRVRPPSVATGPDDPIQTEPHHHRNIQGIVDANKVAFSRSQGIQPSMCRGAVRFDNVELAYPARPRRQVLSGLSLDVPAGSVVAFVGQSGSGKSSIMALVQHLYEQSAGRVMIDGTEVHELNTQWLSRKVSVVSQEPVLFARSIRRNIIFGLEGTAFEPPMEEIEKAARLANADSFIETLPQKYETDVGERGVQLSGGQKQRIAIARALVRKPQILLLDEATSALDTESEHIVQEAIDHMIQEARGSPGLPGMTVMIVAHRLSTVRSADIIFVIQNGQVVEQGSHAELIQDPDGAYSKLVRRQMEAQHKLDSK